MPTELEQAIALCEEAGLTVVTPRDSKDEQLRGLWDNAMKSLRMASDVAAAGGRLTVRHGTWLNEKADVVALLRGSAMRMVDVVLTGVNVVRERQDAA